MRILPFDGRLLNKEELETFLDSYDYLKTKYDIKFIRELPENINWDKPQMFQMSEDFSLDYFMEINSDNNKSYLLWPYIRYNFIGTKGSSRIGQEYQVWGLARQQNFFAHCIIKPKSIYDRIHNLLSGNINKTGHQAFDRKYQVSMISSVGGINDLSNTLLEGILSIDMNDILIELFDNNILISTKRIVDKEICEKVIRFLCRI